MGPRGAYPVDRAAALSGVPRSTVYEWARKDVLLPSISAERTLLWSYADVVGLRLVYWLRHSKPIDDGDSVPGVSMSNVRQALAALSGMERDLWRPGQPPVVAVDRGGRVVLNPRDAPQDLSGQWMLGDAEWLNLLLPFPTYEGTKGPDLIQPRPNLRIIPGKLGGEPHVARSRVETRALAALARRGMGADNIVRLYPMLNQESIVDAIDLEDQLERNLRPAVAA